MQSNLVGLARGHQGIIDNPPMLAHPCTPLRFHALLDLIHRQMRGRSGDSMSHVSCSFPSTLSFPLFYHIERDLVLDVTHVTAENLAAYGRQIRATVLQRTGIPTVVGLASTKTLTKVAVEIANARPAYRHVLAIACIAEEELDELLGSLGVHEVWGIGPRYAACLQAHGIYTARDLKYADQRWIRKHLTVVGHRTQLEL